MGARLSHCRSARLGVLLVAAIAVVGCGSATHPNPLSGVPRSVVLQARPIGRGPRFHPPATGPVLGRCSGSLGHRTGVHVELFALNQVVLVAQGIGTRPPRTLSAGRISGAACFGDLVTIDPTGLVLIRAGRSLTLADLFRSWGQPLSPRQLASFPAPPGTRVSIFVNGRRSALPAARVPLTRHAEIVLEVGPHVPPHASYTFPPGT